MATTTPNNGWPVPTSTDFVKDGATAIESLGDAIDTSVGTGLLAWTAYTPTLGNVSLGNGTVDFKYSQLGKVVHVRGILTFGSTTTVSGAITFSTPVTAASAGGLPLVGTASMNDSGASTYTGFVGLNSTTQFGLFVNNASATYAVRNGVTATVPITWGTADSILFQALYQAA